MQPQNIDREDFDFKRTVTQKVDQQIKKFDSSSYKKLAFLAVAVGVFVSAGVFFGNHVAPTIMSNTHIMEKIVPSKEIVLNLNQQLSTLSSQDFDNTVQYYQKVMNMYDNKLDYVNKTLIAYNLQASGLDVEISQDSLKKMSGSINEHKENISEIITKFTSLKNKIVAKDSLNYEEAQFVLNSVEKAKQQVLFQNSEVEMHFNKNLVAVDKDIARYLSKENVYDKIKELDNEIKQSFQLISNSVKPKI